MVTSCSAYYCTYRHKKGDKTGIYRFPKEEYLRKLWLTAMRRENWKPAPSSRICGKHFLTGRPSKDPDHPDYVPSIFSFDQNKNKQKKVCQKEILHIMSSDIHDFRKLNQKPEGKSMPLVPIKAGERLIKPVPFIHYVGKSENTKENDIIVKKAETAVSSNNKGVFIKQDIRPSVPQNVCLLNFIPAKNNPDMPVKIASVSSVNENHLSSAPNISVVCDSNGPFCVESSVTIDDDSRLSAYSDESTLTAKSSIIDEDTMFLSDESSMKASQNFDDHNVESSELVTKDSTVCNTESSIVASKDSAVCNVDTEEEHTSENMTNDTLDDISNSIIKSTKESSDYYLNFMGSPNDTKDVLAIKLETMIAINMSLREKVKFYQNKCKLYENEINNLKKLNKKSMNKTSRKNSMKCVKIKQEVIE